jgi:D-alanine-D-alanine ligase
MTTSRVLVLYNEPTLPSDHPHAESEHEVVDTARFIGQALEEAGYQVEQLGISSNPERLLAELRDRQPDVVFNLFEGSPEDGATEAYVGGLLEWLRIPFTGCPSSAMSIARCKHRTKQLLKGAGLSTPKFLVLENGECGESELRWPRIVKPATRDASEGLDQGSVVRDQAALEKRVLYLLEHYGPPVLIEEFIDGREFNVALAELPELQALPASEIEFHIRSEDYWPILTYDAKWKACSQEFELTPPVCPARISPKLAERLEDLARRAFHLLGCRGYARVDFRVNRLGKPYILEVNPNPDLHPTAGFLRCLETAGVQLAEFARYMVQGALSPRQFSLQLCRQERVVQ